jgi:hypothetical protein
MSQTSVRRSGGRAAQRKGAKKSNRPLIIGAVVGVLAVMVVAGLLLANGGGSTVGQQFAEQGGANPHILQPTDPHPAYNSNPPTSGWHTGGNIGPWGVVGQPIPDEITLHNLEHGGIFIHYRQDIDKRSLDQLTSLTRQLQQQSPCVVLMPRPADKIDTPVAVTAWTWLLKLDSVDAGQIQSFFRQHVDRGPEKVGCQLRS